MGVGSVTSAGISTAREDSFDNIGIPMWSRILSVDHVFLAKLNQDSQEEMDDLGLPIAMPFPHLQILDHSSTFHFIPFPSFNRHHPSISTCCSGIKGNVLNSNRFKFLFISSGHPIGWCDLEIKQDRR